MLLLSFCYLFLFQVSDIVDMTPSPSKTSGRTRGPSGSLDLVRPDLPSKCTWHLGINPEKSVHKHVKQ